VKKTYQFHDLANVFPMLAGNDAKALARDIFERGLHEPITLHEGKILDGRNRYNACLDAGVEPRFTPYKGNNAVAFVVSRNLTRRHLGEGQRAMIAKKLATLEHGQRQTGKFAGVTTQAQAASMLNVSERSVRTAGAIIDNAVPEIVKAVEKGTVSLSAAAKFAKQPKKEQAKQVREANTPPDAVKAHRKGLSTRSGRPNEVVDGIVASTPKPPEGPSVTHIDTLRRFAEFCDTNQPGSVVAGMLPMEVEETRASLAVITRWVVGFQHQVNATHITTKAGKGPRGPETMLPAKRELVAPQSESYPDLPVFLDRRRKAAQQKSEGP
jgi:hypothetical protein